MNRTPLAEGEWYHCYNRGVDKRKIFLSYKDYERFLMLLYIANSTERVHLSNLSQGKQGPTLLEVLKIERPQPLVTLGAFSLMPNHFHILARPLVAGGLSLFMQKLATGYGMYFNKKYERSGTLLQGKFKSKRIDKDTYLRRLINYIHANPAELYEPGWKTGKIVNEDQVAKKLSQYRFSSLGEFLRDEPLLTDLVEIKDMLEKPLDLADLFEEARIFAREEIIKVGP